MGKLAAEAFCHFERFRYKESPLADDRVNIGEGGTAISKTIGEHIEAQYLTRERLLANRI